MPQETLGYVEMEWTCKRCNTKNPGLQKTCKNCGAAIEADQKFEKASEGTLIKDAQKVEQAKKGADVICPFCSTSNAGDAKVCKSCGGDLTKGQKREAGQVVGAHSSAPAAKVICPNCQTPNSASASNCASCGRPLGNAVTQPAPVTPARAAMPQAAWIGIAVGILLLLCVCGGLYFAFFNTTDVVGTVSGVAWERSIGIEARRPVEKVNWRDSIPQDAEIKRCEEQPRNTSSSPDPVRRSEKICGTPYQVDLGNGLSEVRQDCNYQIYDERCSYTVLEWTEIDREVARGTDLNPSWPQISLAQGEREGSRQEDYDVTFTADGASYTYDANANEFAQFDLGSRWTLAVNGIGGVNSVEPAR